MCTSPFDRPALWNELILGFSMDRVETFLNQLCIYWRYAPTLLIDFAYNYLYIKDLQLLFWPISFFHLGPKGGLRTLPHPYIISQIYSVLCINLSQGFQLIELKHDLYILKLCTFPFDLPDTSGWARGSKDMVPPYIISKIYSMLCNDPVLGHFGVNYLYIEEVQLLFWPT